METRETPPAPARPRRSRLLVVALAAAVLLTIACASDDSGGGSGSSSANGAASSADSDVGGEEAGTDEAPANPCKDTPDEVDLDTVSQALYAGRPDTQASDHEAAVGDCVRISGLTAFVDGAQMETPEFREPQLVVRVTERNRSDEAKPYNPFEWAIQTPEGQVLDPSIFGPDDRLGAGDLVPGGSVSGSIAFDVGPGTYFVIWKPSAFDDARGIWQVTA